MTLRFQYGEQALTLEAEPEPGGWRVRLPDGSEHHVAARRLPDDVLELTQHSTLDTQHSTRIPFARTDRGIELSYDGAAYVFEEARERAEGRPARAEKASGELTAPMPGVVADVLVTEGQTVEAYQPLVVVEAMKVMATVEAPFAGTVAKVHVRKGQQVKHGEPLVEVRREA